jgi:hypothetical protein
LLDCLVVRNNVNVLLSEVRIHVELSVGVNRRPLPFHAHVPVGENELISESGGDTNSGRGYILSFVLHKLSTTNSKQSRAGERKKKKRRKNRWFHLLSSRKEETLWQGVFLVGFYDALHLRCGHTLPRAC